MNSDQQRGRTSQDHWREQFYIGIAMVFLGVVSISFGAIEIVMGNQGTAYVSGALGAMAMVTGGAMVHLSSGELDD